MTRTIDQRLAHEVKSRLLRDYKMRDAGTWLRGGICPKCSKKELFARAEAPHLVICGRKDKCGEEIEVAKLYPDLFDDWSTQTKEDPSPTAAADGYLAHARGFDLAHLRGHYSQEWYQDRKRGIGSATVRFALPGGSWWERLIDQPGRFERKANFAPTATHPGYQGQAWMLPERTIADYAGAREIWLTEGIFNSLALEQGAFAAERRDADDGAVGDLTASLMSCYNYPEHFLRDLRIAIASGATPTQAPRLVFALDNGPAGTEYTRRWVKKAREEGWSADAALGRLDDEPGADLDWNDLHKRERLAPADRKRYRWHGDVLVAADEREKAFLIWREKRWQAFHLTFGGRTWWATFSESAIKERIGEGFEKEPEISVLSYDEKVEHVARQIGRVDVIANCTFRALFFERNEVTDTSCYWVRVDRPGDFPSVKASFPGPALAGSGEFKKRLISVASGAIWTGEQFHLDRITQRQLPVRDVDSIEFTGYCRDHAVYVLGDLAVSKGRVYRPNDDGYFDVGKTAIKLRTSERILDAIEYNPDHLDATWLDDFWTAWGPKGLVLLAFMGGLSLIAEQARGAHKSLGFLEVTGPPGTGKTTAAEFIWKLLGRENYEGFDPAKSTQAGIARELAKVGNLPVVFIEGDRTDDAPHGRKFDWDETKTLFNGRATRTRGVKNDGLETYSPPFRGAFTIVQNEAINSSRAVLERIMSIHFDKNGWSPDTKAAAERIENWPIEKVSGYIVHFARREPEILARYIERYAVHEKALVALPGVSIARLAKNHAQLLAMLDCLPIVLPGLRKEWLAATDTFVRTMTVDRHKAVAHDHPHVELFWERFDYLESTAPEGKPINHSRSAETTIAINLNEFEQICGERRLSLPPINELKKALRQSKRYPLEATKPVNSITGRSLYCWVFQRTPAPRT